MKYGGCVDTPGEGDFDKNEVIIFVFFQIAYLFYGCGRLTSEKTHSLRWAALKIQKRKSTKLFLGVV